MRFIPPLATLLLIPACLTAVTAAPIAAPTPTVMVDVGRKSAVRDAAYMASGSGFYHAMMGKIFPFANGRTSSGPFALPVDWRTAASDNPDRLPLQGWTVLDYGGVQAEVAVFAARHVQGIGPLFDAYFRSVASCDHLSVRQRRKIAGNARTIRSRSTVFIASFDEATARLVYYPGQILFRGGGDRKLGRWLRNVPEDIRSGKRTDWMRIGSSKGLMAVFNGTFDRSDNEGEWLGDRFARGGFGFDFRRYYRISPEMGTVAVYEDGSLEIASFKNLPEHDRIRWFTQNCFMVVEDGKPARDARSRKFVRFHDNFARAYIFRDGRGHFGYLWTMYLPQDVTADLALRLGIRDLILTDIHSTISCTLSDPSRPLDYADERDYEGKSIDFVPVFSEYSGIFKPIVGLSRLMKKNIQSPYVYEAFNGAWDDFFAVFRKGSPEAMRMQAGRDR
jgi:hypothetical protein